MKNKNKISDAQLLQQEKKRLQNICALQEAKLHAHIQEFRSHSFSMVMHSFLPFETGTNNKVISMVGLLNETIIPALFGISFGKEKGDTSGNLMKLIRTMMISLSFKLLKKIFSKKPQETTE